MSSWHRTQDWHIYEVTEITAHTAPALVQTRQGPSTEKWKQIWSPIHKQEAISSWYLLGKTGEEKIGFLQWSVTEYINYTPEQAPTPDDQCKMTSLFVGWFLLLSCACFCLVFFFFLGFCLLISVPCFLFCCFTCFHVGYFCSVLRQRKHEFGWVGRYGGSVRIWERK